MLELFRQHVGGLLGALIVSALVIVFAFSFGDQSQGWCKGSAEQFVATVNGEDISESTLRFATNLIGGRNVDRRSNEWSELQRGVLEGLVERQLLIDMADELGFTVSTEEAEKAVARNEFFLTRPIDSIFERMGGFFPIPDTELARFVVADGHRIQQTFNDQSGKFSLTDFNRYVTNYLQSSEQAFVEQQRQELIALRMRELIVAAVTISPDEVRDVFNRENDTAQVAYLRLTPAWFADRLAPTAEEMAAFTQAAATDIQAYYDNNKFLYTNLEKQVRARHILLKVEEGASPEDAAKVEAEAKAVLARVKGGEDFAAVAREKSQDPGSAAKGGDLDYNTKGRMVPEFDEVMFTLAPGGISDLVKTKFGFHIIKVEDVREGNVTLEQATPEIAAKLFKDKNAKSRMEATANEWLARAKAGESLESLVPADQANLPEPMQLKIRTSPAFTRGDPSIGGVGQAGEIVTAAFAATLEQPLIDRVFTVGEDRFLVRLEKRERPTDERFAEAKEKLGREVLARKQASWLRDRLHALTTAAEKEGRLERRIQNAAVAPADGTAKPPTESPAADSPAGPADGKPVPTPEDN
ncbi:MAG TPA: peptidylprolyl isomerase [Candidatus Paceibacterota bacterium]|nr:peptidylprolyl isomerase [Candidatus Paceibacterota bacterium]